MKTKELIEDLLYRSNSKNHLKKALKVCRVINDTDRDWRPKAHPHLSVYTKEFKEPIIICVISTIITTYIIEPESKRRVHPIIVIRGSHSEFMTASRDLLGRMLNQSARVIKHLPEPYTDQVYWIPYKKDILEVHDKSKTDFEILETLEGKSQEDEFIDMIVFSRHLGDQWTIEEDITKGNITKKMKTSFYKIFKKLVWELR